MAQAVKTAVQFSGLSTYPNPLSAATPGALQRATNVVIERPSVITPRKGQQRFTRVSNQVTNVFAANVATGTDTDGDLTGFTHYDPEVYMGAPTDADGVTSTAYAWQGSRSVALLGLASVTINQDVTGAAQYVLTLWARGPATTGVDASIAADPGTFRHFDLIIIDATSAVVAEADSLPALPDAWSRYALRFTAPGTGGSVPIQIGIRGLTDEIYVDGLQLEQTTAFSEWTDPTAPADFNTVSRLFQSTDDLVGFVTADGLPASIGQLVTLENAVVTTNVPTGGTFFPPPGNAMHGFQSGQALYATTADGVYQVVGDSAATLPAGVPAGLDVQAATAVPAAGTLGFLAGGFATAYRVVFGNVSAANGAVTLGAPSNSVTLSNPGTIGDTNAYWDPTMPTLPGSFQATANVFTVTLPFAKLGATGTLTYDCYVIQGNNTLKAKLYIATGAGSTAYVRITDPLAYLGAHGNTVTIVLPFSATAAGTVLTTVNFDGRIFAGTATGVTLYETFAAGDPANLASATLTSTVASAAAGTVTATAGAWTSGMIGAVFAATVDTAQSNNLLKTAGTFLVHADDELAFTSLTDRIFVSAVTPASGGFDIITLDVFPAGLDASGSHQPYDIYRSVNATVTFTVPPEVAAYPAAFYQVYRSYVPAEITTGIDPVPTDNMQLCYQGTPSGTTVSVTDIAPDGVLGAALYTSPNQGTILKAHYQPPVCSDAALYQNCGLYANTYAVAQFTTQLLATTTAFSGTILSPALQPDDVFFVNHVPITAVSGAPASVDQFEIISGTGSVVQDINGTLVNLVRTINQLRIPLLNAGTPDEIVTAQVTSALSSGVPGGSLILQASRGTGSFEVNFGRFVTVWRADAVTPFVGVPLVYRTTAGDNAYYFHNDPTLPTNQPNALYFSDAAQPEAVPLLNYLQVGAANYPIKRIVALSTSCLIFKEDGLFQLTGSSPEQFQIQQLSPTVQLVSNESAIALQNSVVAMTSKGVISVGDGGSIQVLSQAITADLLNLTSLAAFASTSFGVANEAKSTYLLFSPTADEDTLPTQAYVFNMQTNAWTRFDLARICGLSNLADQCVYLGAAVASIITGTPTVYRELVYADVPTSYGDEPTVGTVTAYDASGVTLDTGTVPAANVASAFADNTTLVSDLGTLALSAITAVDSHTVSCIYALSATGDPGATATIYYPTTCDVAPVPIAADDPGMVKQFQEVVLTFINTTTADLRGTFASDYGQSYAYFPFTIPRQTAALVGATWGEGSWGVQWGGGSAAPDFLQTARQLVPRDAARGHTLNFGFLATVAATYFGLTGLTLGWAPTQSLRTK